MKKQKRSPSIITRIRRKWFYILPVLILIAVLPFLQTKKRRNDVLVYSVGNYDNGQASYSLMSYNPNTGKKTTLLHDNDLSVSTFSVSPDGRLAYSSRREGNAEIYVGDNLSPNSPDINITQSPDLYEYPLAWSPDGHYLAFTSRPIDGADKSGIYVWDGANITAITPTDMREFPRTYSEISWSFDGRLAFTEFHDSTNKNYTPSEIYVWDGSLTTSLSQNPSGEDGSPAWNTDGELAFLSEREGVYDIFVWDGVSFKDGMPDVDTFTNIAPEQTGYYSHPVWTNLNQLAFNSQSLQDNHVQVYVWDGNTTTNFSQNPNLHNGTGRWYVDGR